MTAIVDNTTSDEIRLTRALDDGLLTFTDNGRSRIYRHEPANAKARRLTAVSTILGILDKPALLRWYEGHGAAGALAAVRMGELNPALHADDEAINVVRALDLGADAAKRKAAVRGLTVHDALQVWCEDGDLPQIGDLDPEHRPYYQALMKALLALDPEPVQVEQITCSLTYGYAGRFDLRARVHGRDTLLDLKTVKRGRPYAEGHLQLAGYAVAECELGANWPDRMVVLGVGPDGEYVADEGCGTADAWLAVLKCFREVSAVRSYVDALARADKKAKAA